MNVRENRQRVAIAVLTIAIMWAVIPTAIAAVSALASVQDEFGRPNPEAPAEIAQYSFMIGEWDCTVRSLNSDGSYLQSTARWRAWYILDGWAIQDEWTAIRPDGAVFKGINIRSFNKELKKWECRWLPAISLQWKYFQSEKVGDTMVMLGEGEDQRGKFIDRNTFYDISEDSWSWKKDYSYDDGKSWIENIVMIEAKRTR